MALDPRDIALEGIGADALGIATLGYLSGEDGEGSANLANDDLDLAHVVGRALGRATGFS